MMILVCIIYSLVKPCAALPSRDAAAGTVNRAGQSCQNYDNDNLAWVRVRAGDRTGLSFSWIRNGSELLRAGPVTQDGGGKAGLRFSRNAVAPSTMSVLPTACMSMPSPVEKESRAAFHQTLELIFAISR